MLLIAGCGDVGCALAKRALAEGKAVAGIRREVSRLPKGVVPIAADMRSLEELRAALSGIASKVDELVYAAAADERTPEAYEAAYVTGFQNVLSLLQPRRVVFTSSTAVYGQKGAIDESVPPEPAAFSGETMLRAEALIPEGGVSLRFGGIYGPGRTMLIRKTRAGEPMKNRMTNRIHRDDCAGSIEHMLRLDAPERIYIGVDRAQVPLADVISFIAEEIGVKAPSVDGSALGKSCSSAKLQATGYSFLYPTFREGYRQVLAAS